MRDLIARVLAEHRVRVHEDPATPVFSTWSCRCGAWRNGWCSAERASARADEHVADAIVAAIEASQPDHIIELRPDGWIIQHSMPCRLGGRLFDCPLVAAVYIRADAGCPPKPGRYRCTVDANGGIVIGERVA